jgi:hypothetical protein
MLKKGCKKETIKINQKCKCMFQCFNFNISMFDVIVLLFLCNRKRCLLPTTTTKRFANKFWPSMPTIPYRLKKKLVVFK